MKIAISGKGGVGKTLLSAFLIRKSAADGWDVIAIDADPDANLAMTLGFSETNKIIPISHMKSLVEERAGAKGGYFRLNPKVDDLPETYSIKQDGIRLMVMGEVKRGGSGCYCPENALLGSLMAHLLLGRREMVIMDMAAGIEHLSRGTAQAVDWLIIVVEPGRASLDTALRVRQLATDLGIKQIAVVGNKIQNEQQKSFIAREIDDLSLLGFIPYDPDLVDFQIKGIPITASTVIDSAVNNIYQSLAAGTLNNSKRGN